MAKTDQRRFGPVGGFGEALGRFVRDVRGVAAVEFGFIAPIMVVMLIGAVEVTRAVSIDRRLSVVTNMVADLVAREEQLTANDVNAIYDIAEKVMAPYEANVLKMSVIPVMSSPTNASDVRVYPATTNRPSFNGGIQPAKCQSYGLTTGLLSTNESVIVVEATYQFTPMFAGLLMGAMEWTEKAIAKPRKALCVAFDGATCSTTCFAS